MIQLWKGNIHIEKNKIIIATNGYKTLGLHTALHYYG
jgi:hypothetical protein